MIRTSPTPSEWSPVAIGKFARHPEYLRARGDALLETFDSWLSEGFDLAADRFGTAWRGMFQMGIPHGVLWHAGGEEGDPAEWFCGVLAPSQDSVGRQYPLAVGARISHPPFAQSVHTAPLAVGGLLDVAYATISEARGALLSRQELDERLRAIEPPGSDAFTRAEMEYAEWCASTPADVGWSALFPSDDPVATARTAIGHLTAAVARPRVVLRLPIGAAPAGATALWLDVLRRVGVPLSSAFWAVYDGALLVTRGAPEPALVGCLWMRGAATESMLDLSDLHAPVRSSGVRSALSSSNMRSFLDSLTA